MTILLHPTFFPAMLLQCGLHGQYEEKNVIKTLSVFIQSHKREMDSAFQEQITLVGAGMLMHLFHSPDEISLEIT